MVIKFNVDGRVAMVFGRKHEASDEGTGPLKHPKPPLPPVDGLFRQVTDMAWDSAGNTYISDGYINSRIAKVDKDGNWLTSWGEPGDKPGQLSTPHSIAIDAQNNVYVADRGNRRIQVFDTDGKFLRQITIDVPAPADARPAIGNKPTSTTGTMSPGAPWTVCITPGPNQVLFTSDAFPGRIYKLSLDGKVLGVFGKSGKQLGQFGWIHAHRLPLRKRTLRRRAPELAHPKTSHRIAALTPVPLFRRSGLQPRRKRCAINGLKPLKLRFATNESRTWSFTCVYAAKHKSMGSSPKAELRSASRTWASSCMVRGGRIG